MCRALSLIYMDHRGFQRMQMYLLLLLLLLLLLDLPSFGIESQHSKGPTFMHGVE